MPPLFILQRDGQKAGGRRRRRRGGRRDKTLVKFFFLLLLFLLTKEEVKQRLAAAPCQVFEFGTRKWKRDRAEPLISRFVGHQLVQPWTNRATSRAPGLEIIRNGKERKRLMGAGLPARRFMIGDNHWEVVWKQPSEGGGLNSGPLEEEYIRRTFRMLFNKLPVGGVAPQMSGNILVQLRP